MKNGRYLRESRRVERSMKFIMSSSFTQMMIAMNQNGTIQRISVENLFDLELMNRAFSEA